MIKDDKIIIFMLKYTDNCSITNKTLNNSKFACKMMINNNTFYTYL